MMLCLLIYQTIVALTFITDTVKPAYVFQEGIYLRVCCRVSCCFEHRTKEV